MFSHFEWILIQALISCLTITAHLLIVKQVASPPRILGRRDHKKAEDAERIRIEERESVGKVD